MYRWDGNTLTDESSVITKIMWPLAINKLTKKNTNFGLIFYIITTNMNMYKGPRL